MLVEEGSLAVFRKCPRASVLLQDTVGNSSAEFLRGSGIDDPVQTITRWMWAQEFRTGDKVTLRSTKHKWGQVVTAWAKDLHLPHRETRDHIALHSNAIMDYHDFYVMFEGKLVSVGQPIRLKVGAHVLETLPQVVMELGSRPILLNTSCDTSDFETKTNFVYQARLLALVSATGLQVSFLNHRFGRKLETLGTSSRQVCPVGFGSNLHAVLNLMDAGFDAPGPRCGAKCLCRKEYK